MKFVIAIDGTASSGKSTTAKLLAARLGFTHLDTGAMYRAVTYLLISKDAVETRDEQVKKILEQAKLKFSINNKKLYIHLDDELLDDELRTPEVDQWVSPVAEKALVRAYLVAIQRKLGAARKLVCEGRDIGSVVFPDAELKIFMKCDITERAKRRTRELSEKGVNASEDKVLANLSRRDDIDSGRKIAPLTQTEDAIVVDTTDLTIDEQVNLIAEQAMCMLEEMK